MVDFAEKLDWKDGPAGNTPVTAAEILRIEQGLRDMRDAVNAFDAGAGSSLVAKGELTVHTVISAGASKTIDGAASKVLAAWQGLGFVSDGTQWLSL
ncbi:MAG TPA: hypothetical protein VIO38_10700 [Rariglobus sp.]